MKMKAKIFVFLVAALFIGTTFVGASVITTSEEMVILNDPEPKSAAGQVDSTIWYFNTDPPEWPIDGPLFEKVFKFHKVNREISSGTDVTFVIKVRMGDNEKPTSYRMDVNLWMGTKIVFTKTHYWEPNPDGNAGDIVSCTTRHNISFDEKGTYTMWVTADSYRTKDDTEPTYQHTTLMKMRMYVDTEAPLTKTMSPMANNLFYLLSNLRFKQQNIFNL